MIDRTAAAKAGAVWHGVVVGNVAFQRGQSPVDCPHVLDTSEWRQWMKGWQMGYLRRFKGWRF